MKRFAAIVAATSVALTACADDDEVVGPAEGEAAFAVVLQPEGQAAMLRAETPGADARATIELDEVSAITLPIGRVEARLGGAASEEWVEAGVIGETVNLLDLPEDGLVLLDSFLPEGEYTALRFFLTDEATITLESDVTVGRTTFEAGTHPLEIPSADQNGLRLAADFVVDEDGEVLTVLVDGDATLTQVTATGSGVLKIAPELRVTNESGEDVGEFDPDDDDGEDEEEIEVEGMVASVMDGGFTLEDGTTVRVLAETEIEGDLLSLAAVSEALANGETVEAEAEGRWEDDGQTLIADKVEFETDDDDGDGELDDDDEEVEVEGFVTALDRSAMTFQVERDGETVTVVMGEETDVELDGFESLDEVVEALDAGLAVQAEAEGEWDAEGRLLADDVEFELHEEELEGTVVAIDRDDVDSFTVQLESGEEVRVVVTDGTEFDDDSEYLDFDALASAFDAGTTIRAEVTGIVHGDEGFIVANEVEFEATL